MQLVRRDNALIRQDGGLFSDAADLFCCCEPPPEPEILCFNGCLVPCGEFPNTLECTDRDCNAQGVVGMSICAPAALFGETLPAIGSIYRFRVASFGGGSLPHDTVCARYDGEMTLACDTCTGTQPGVVAIQILEGPFAECEECCDCTPCVRPMIDCDDGSTRGYVEWDKLPPYSTPPDGCNDPCGALQIGLGDCVSVPPNVQYLPGGESPYPANCGNCLPTCLDCPEPPDCTECGTIGCPTAYTLTAPIGPPSNYRLANGNAQSCCGQNNCDMPPGGVWVYVYEPDPPAEACALPANIDLQGGNCDSPCGGVYGWQIIAHTCTNIDEANALLPCVGGPGRYWTMLTRIEYPRFTHDMTAYFIRDGLGPCPIGAYRYCFVHPIFPNGDCDIDGIENQVMTIA